MKLQTIATTTATVAPVYEPALKAAAPRPGLWRGDTLAQSVVALLVLAVAQRVIGFGRSVLVCRWLTPAELGEWDLANRFFVLAAPLVVLGLPADIWTANASRRPASSFKSSGSMSDGLPGSIHCQTPAGQILPPVRSPAWCPCSI